MSSACAPLTNLPFDERLIAVVQRLVSTPIRENVQGSLLTTFAIGGRLRAVVTVENGEELSKLVALLSREGQGYRVLGNGSNVLFGDAPSACWIIKLGAGFRRVECLSRGKIEVFGSVSLMSFARKVSDDGLSGLEFAAGIPATVGGAVFMNAGAHGGEICSRIVEVRGVLADGSSVVWARNELPWGYRHSGLPSGSAVTSVRFSLVEGDRTTISGLCAHNLAERRARQPLSLPSAGSVFKNPSPELAAGMVLERIGMKGAAVGGATISEMHANWIVNPKREARAKDVVDLIEACKAKALAEEGIVLEPEVRLWT
ncbi:MAG: UDP-N-acetylenolpyruvoylglucosamine reductase [Pseudomonadota bacterium]